MTAEIPCSLLKSSSAATHENKKADEADIASGATTELHFDNKSSDQLTAQFR